MKFNRRGWKKLFVQLYIRFKDDGLSALSAQLTFYLLLSLFPFLLFLLNLLSFTRVSAGEFAQNITKFMPRDVALFINGAINELVLSRSPALLSVSALITLISASGGINAVSRGLNKAYDMDEKRPFWKVKIISVVFTIGIAIIMLTALLFLIFGDLIGVYIFSYLPDTEALLELWAWVRYAVPVGMMIFVFSLLYMCVPDCKIRFKEALPGSLFSTAGWIAVSAVFSVYVNNFSGFTRIYGSIGGIIILLIWIYLSSMVILLGGEINAALLYFRSGKKIDKYENHNVKVPFLNRFKKRHPPGRMS